MAKRTLLGPALLLVSATAAWSQQPEKPKALEELKRYAGDWASEITSKQAEWTPAEVKYQASSHGEFVLNGWHLLNVEVNHVVGQPDRIAKALWMTSYDEPSKTYVTWSFHSSGVVARWSGNWLADERQFRYAPSEPLDGMTALFREQFPQENAIAGALTFKKADGAMLLDMEWTRTKQPAAQPNPLREQWSKIGTPIEPIPDEMKHLDPFVGDWDAEFIQKPSIAFPNGNTAKAKMTVQRILDGRFLLGSTELPSYQSLWVVGYDAQAKAYRSIRWGNDGRIVDGIGQWNAENRALELTGGLRAPNNLTVKSTWRIVSADVTESTTKATLDDGRVQLDAVIKSTRRK